MRRTVLVASAGIVLMLSKKNKNWIKNARIEKIVKGVYMDSSMWDDLENEAKKDDRSTNWMITNILKTWIKNKKKARAKGR